MLDLNEFKTDLANSGAKMIVRHPVTGADVDGAFVVLLGRDGDEARAMRRQKTQRFIDRAARSKGKPAALTVDEIESIALDEIVELTVRIDGLQMDGIDIGKDKALIRSAYEQYSWLAEQAGEFVDDRSNFFGKPKKG